ncbi:hypothetical protein [Palleronia pelagia]|uniref:Uncharacterized protein n=1 Tax=Palleronia pelagia TaxID=387096 RepID=A0A1H8I5T0_9RHOB|nr:hypothetical protein [Palleronia pelagia]SEN63983.1 hypothetical protein SAMN04488011_105118 [Palleronia pelagia]
MILSFLNNLYNRCTVEHLRLEEREDAIVLHRDTWITRNARTVEGGMLVAAAGLGAMVVGMWVLPGAVWLAPLLVLKAAVSLAGLWAAALLARSARLGVRVGTRIDRRAGRLEIVQSAFRGPPQVIERIPLCRIESFFILREREGRAASHLYARLAEGRDAIYLGSDSDPALERLHAQLSGASVRTTEAMLTSLVGRARMREARSFG